MAGCKDIEAALRESERKLALFIENAPAAIAMFDCDMRYLAVSRRWLMDYGLGDQDVIGRTHYEVFPEIPERWKRIHRRALGGEAQKCEEDPFPRLDGKTDWVRWEIIPWCRHNGKISGIIMFTEVITERKWMEEELRVHRDRLETLVAQRTEELEERNRKLSEEIKERRKAEEEKSRAEYQLAQAQRIEALDRFAGGIAHDLNNILYPIMINMEELLDDEPKGSSRHELLDQTLKAVIRQKDLVRKILSFARQAEDVFRPVRVAPLVEETLDFLRSTIPSSIDMQQRVDASCDVIMGDPTQLQQVIMNLVQNAADSFEERKGAIEVGLKAVHLEPVPFDRGMKAGDYLELTVRDTGSGIPPGVLVHIFEPFYTTKCFGKGSGMGLSVVYGIVKRHGGHVTVVSRGGEGTLFTVYLPVYTGEIQAEAASPETDPSPQGREKILLVDDEDLVLTSLQRVLRMSGYRVVALRDSEEALTLFEKEPQEFDLLITDLTMPKLTGIDLIRRVLKIRPGLPVILSTGYNEALSGREAGSLGIRELLPKPSNSTDLKKIVRRALEP